MWQTWPGLLPGALVVAVPPLHGSAGGEVGPGGAPEPAELVPGGGALVADDPVEVEREEAGLRHIPADGLAF